MDESVHDRWLRYRMETSSHLIPPGLPAELLAAGDVELTLTATALHIERRGVHGLAVGVRSGERLWMDHKRREFSWLAGAPPAAEADARWSLRPLPAPDHDVEMEGGRVPVDRHLLSLPELELELWSEREPGRLNAAIGSLWRMMLPTVTPEQLPRGLPVRAILRERGQPPVNLLSLVQMRELETAPALAPPEGYRPPERIRRSAPRSAEAIAVRTQAIGKPPRTGAAADVSVVFRDPSLDQLRVFVNRFTAGLSASTSSRQPPTLEIDWWSAVDHQLQLSDPEKAQLKVILLAALIAEGEPLASLALDKQALYQQVVDQQASDFRPTVQEARLFAFIADPVLAPLSGSLAEAEFASFTTPIQVEFPIPEVHNAGHLIDVVFLKADTSFQAGAGGIIHSLELVDGAVRLVVDIAHLDVEVGYQISASRSTANLLLNTLTFGAWRWLVSDFGDLHFHLDGRVAFDLVPGIDLGQLQFDLVPNRDASSFSTSAYTLGFNPLLDVFGGIAELILSQLDYFNKVVIQNLADKIKDKLHRDFLRFPHTWNNDLLPTVTPDGAAISPLTGALEGTLSPSLGVPALASSAIALAQASNHGGYLMSQRYLTAWVRLSIGQVVAMNQTPAEVATSLGVTLPDPALIDPQPAPVNDPGDGRRPAVPPAEYQNQFLVERTLPEVLLPPDGISDNPGRARVEYTVSLVASETAYAAQLVPLGPGNLAWRVVSSTRVLARYLEARVSVETPLQLGFREGGRIWLPEPALTVADDQGLPRLQVALLALTTEAPLAGVDPGRLTAFVQQLCIFDAQALFVPMVAPPETSMHSLTKREELVPGEGSINLLTLGQGLAPVPPGVNDRLYGMVSFRQAGNTERPIFAIAGRMLLWPLEMHSRL